MAYTREFKQEAIKLVTEQGYKPKVAARKLGIPHSSYDQWLKAAGYVKPQPVLPDNLQLLKAQLREAQGRLKELEMENEILKKATAYFAKQSG